MMLGRLLGTLSAMPYNTPPERRRGNRALDSTDLAAPLVKRQADALIADETCPGTCNYVDGEVVALPPANGHYPPEFLHQTCGECGRERLIAPPENPRHLQIKASLDTRINTIPAILGRYASAKDRLTKFGG